MMQVLQMLMQNKMQQIPQQLMTQLEQQLKRTNPQAYKEFREARQNNVNPQEYLNKITNNFNPQQKQQWDNMMGQFGKQGNNDDR